MTRFEVGVNFGMTFKDMKDEQDKESIFKLLTPADKSGIIVGVVINVALIILYIVMRFC